MADCSCNHFPASLGNVTFDAGVRVGVGTATPQAPLAVATGSATVTNQPPAVLIGGDISAETPSAKLMLADTSGAGNPWFEWQTIAGGPSRLRLNAGSGGVATGADLLSVTSAGSVGIGTASPAEALELGSGLNVGVRVDPGNDTANGLVSYALRSRESGGTIRTWKVYTAPVGGGYGVAPNSCSVWDYPGSPGSGTAANERFTILPVPDGATTPAAVVTIDGAGRLGVGTASPSQALDVNGTLHVSGGALVDQGGCYYAN